MAADEVRRRRGAIASGGFADRPDLHLVLRVPHVQQENVIHQHGVRRDHATFQENRHGYPGIGAGAEAGGRLGSPVPTLP